MCISQGFARKSTQAGHQDYTETDKINKQKRELGRERYEFIKTMYSKSWKHFHKDVTGKIKE